MTHKKLYKSVSLDLDIKNNLYWLFPYNTTEDGFNVLSFPAKKFDVATTDYKTLVMEALDLMKYCKFVKFEDAEREIDMRFKKKLDGIVH